MALTPEGTPYVESSDLVANYPAASLSLANRVDLVGVLPFATSTARATAIPSPTDGQYTYLQDTNLTQFWNGSAWQTAGSTPALTMVNPTSIANSGGTSSATGGEVTFTAVNSVSLNGVFTATYDNYLIKMINTKSANGNIQIRVRAAGTDLTTSTYAYGVGFVSTAAVGFEAGTASGTFGLVNFQQTSQAINDISIGSPFLAANTNIGSNSATNAYFHYSFIQVANTTSYDGFTMFPATGTFTGKIRVYGYQNS